MSSDFGKAGDVFVRYLAERIRASGSGAGSDGELVYPDRARDRFFIGRLAPGGTEEAEEDILENAEDFYSKLDPCSMQFRFLLWGPATAKVVVTPRFNVYARVFPPYGLQLEDATPKFNAGQKEATILPVFRRVTPKVGKIELEVGKIGEGNRETEVVWERGNLAGLEGAYRGPADLKVGKEALSSAESYARFVKSVGGEPVVPDIRISVIASAANIEPDLWEMSIALVNRSVDSDPLGRLRLRDEVVFDAGFEAELDGGHVEPYEFPSLPNSYRFDRFMHGSGVNCSVRITTMGPEGPIGMRSEPMPVYEQKRFYHKPIPGLDITFRALGKKDASKTLLGIAAEMRRFEAESWEDKARELEARHGEGAYELEEFRRDRTSFRREIDRFEKGILCLKKPDAARAFSLMNATFELLGGGTRTDWRSFQIVFIVSMLPSVVGREYPELAEADEWEFTDVVWFPTGGGKTEAYLGLTVFAMFFDRLRGRERGVTALYRFPLRLLSLQQFQRIVRAVAAANRTKDEQKIGGDPFAVGHWIGSQGSPNKIDKDVRKLIDEDAASVVDGVSVLTRKYRKIAECPNPGCGDRGIYLRFDAAKWSLQHFCPKCGVLPVYIVDQELYRYLPSIVVGTVDKMAVFGLQRRFVNLLGWTKGHCPAHGYAPENECEMCGKKGLKELPIKDPVPAIHVQDELHLLKEDLGAFASHYETAVMRLQEEIPGSTRPWKTIAATATIEEFERHIEHLYLLKGRRFPTPGPTYEKTFFAETDRELLSRLFVGINPSGLTHINAMVAILWYFHREISVLRAKAPVDFLRTTGLSGLLDKTEVGRFIDQYEINLTYVLTKKAGDQMAESLDAQVGNYLKSQGLPDVVSEVLSGGTTSDKISEVMDRIEKFDLLEPDFSKHIRSIVATSMVSHGVDVERFNFITFFGMPRMTSEYIQASSRVGRNIPGIVLVCFAPARERDRSHYHLFPKYHEYLDRLVEPASINRWSKYSINKTIPGIIIGNIINGLARKVGEKLTTGKRIRKQIPRHLDEERLKCTVRAAYDAGRQPSGEFGKIIEESSNLFIQGLPNNDNYIGKRRNWAPMRSLRDTDQAVSFRPSKYAAPVFEVLLKDRVKEGALDFRGEEVEDDG